MTWETNDSPGNPETKPVTDAVWPPPIYGQTSGQPGAPLPLPSYKFTFYYERVEGIVSDYREGNLSVAGDGLYVNGKMIPRAEIYQSILIAALFARGAIILAYLIMRYGFLRPEYTFIPWSTVRSLTTMPRKRKLCVVFDAPNYKGVIKRFSLTMKFKKEDYAAVTDTLDSAAPGLAQPGVIRSANSPVVLVWMACMLLGLAFILVVTFTEVGRAH